MYSLKSSSCRRSENLTRVVQVILTIRRKRSTMSQQAWNTAMMGLCLTVICLVGASASAAAFKSQTVEKHRELSLIHKDKIHEIITELCSKIPDSFRFLVEGLGNIYRSYFEDRSRFKMQRSDIFEDVVDMTIIRHVGACQCETVMFMVSSDSKQQGRIHQLSLSLTLYFPDGSTAQSQD